MSTFLNLKKCLRIFAEKLIKKSKDKLINTNKKFKAPYNYINKRAH